MVRVLVLPSDMRLRLSSRFDSVRMICWDIVYIYIYIYIFINLLTALFYTKFIFMIQTCPYDLTQNQNACLRKFEYTEKNPEFSI